MKNVKVSVIIPVFNAEKYLAECLESVINQTLKDIEIICVNDGSTDNSAKILKDFTEKDERITLITQPNSGKSAAMNKALSIVRGEYWGFVDSDDFIDSNFYEKLYQRAIDTNADIVRTGYKYFYSKSKIKDSELNPTLEKKFRQNETLNVNNHSVVAVNTIYKTDCLKICFDEELKAAEDILFTTKAVCSSRKTSALYGTFYYYRKQEKITLSTLSEKSFEMTKLATQKTLKYLNSTENLTENEYLHEFIRSLYRYNSTFKKCVKSHPKWLTDSMKTDFARSFVNDFHSCKFPEKLESSFAPKYLEFLKSKDIQGYIKYHERSIFERIIDKIFGTN